MKVFLPAPWLEADRITPIHVFCVRPDWCFTVRSCSSHSKKVRASIIPPDEESSLLDHLQNTLPYFVAALSSTSFDQFKILLEERRSSDFPLNFYDLQCLLESGVYVLFMIAFDSVDRASLWRIIMTDCIPDKLLRLITQTTTRVRTHGQHASFGVGSGVCHGCTLYSLCLTLQCNGC